MGVTFGMIMKAITLAMLAACQIAPIFGISKFTADKLPDDTQ